MSSPKNQATPPSNLAEQPPSEGKPPEGQTLHPAEEQRKLHGDKLEAVASGPGPCKPDKGGAVH